MTERGQPTLDLSPQEEARNRLQQLGMSWNLASFREAVLQNDQAAIELYFKGGFSPNAIFSDWATPDEFLIAIPFAQQTKDRFAVLETFKKHGINFDTENPRGVKVSWLLELRGFTDHGLTKRGRNETMADEIIYYLSDRPEAVAISDIRMLKAQGLSCDQYLNSFNDLVDVYRRGLKAAIAQADLRVAQSKGQTGVAAEVTQQRRQFDASGITDSTKRVEGMENAFNGIKKLCSS